MSYSLILFVLCVNMAISEIENRNSNFSVLEKIVRIIFKEAAMTQQTSKTPAEKPEQRQVGLRKRDSELARMWPSDGATMGCAPYRTRWPNGKTIKVLS